MLDSKGQLKEVSVAVVGRSERMEFPLACAQVVAIVWSHPMEREPHYDWPTMLSEQVIDQSVHSNLSAVFHSMRRKFVGPKALAKNWNIGLAAAERTYKATKQDAVRTLIKPNLS